MSTKPTNAEEDFEFASIPSVGKINVANTSYGDEETKHHIYTVSMADGRTACCTCPADTYHDGRCKHRVAVEDRDTFVREGNCEVCGDTGEHDGVTCFACVKPAATIARTGR